MEYTEKSGDRKHDYQMINQMTGRKAAHDLFPILGPSGLAESMPEVREILGPGATSQRRLTPLVRSVGSDLKVSPS